MFRRLVLMLLVLPAVCATAQEIDLEDILGDGMKWREVGPYRGGRSCTVTGIPDQPNVYYFGATGGGVWKTTDGGGSWKNVSDGYFGGSIGAVAVSEWDPNVIYVGTGEKTIRGNVSHGDGMWKSTDAGRTWSHVGLPDSRHICRVRIHPKNPDLVYAACLGHLYGPNQERGVFRTKDGGKTWERILFANENAGAVDLVMDPTNPRILYASTWRVRRTPWTLESGGEGSDLWKTTDGGDTWTRITGNDGLPKGTIGISGITVSPSNPDNLYAIVESEKGGVFRSRDAGKTWRKTNDERSLRQRAWYYTRLYADTKDEDVVYVLNVSFHRSKDGGRTFSTIRVPHGDNHDLWIAPDDPMRMIQANDGGANVSYDGGKTWSTQENQPTAQMYRVSCDNDFPYRLLGGQQDNSAVRIRSRSLQSSGIGRRDWDPTAGGESGHIVAKPDDPDIVFGGSYGGTLSMVNHRTGERRSVNVWPDNPMGWGARHLKYRFQWNYPIFFSPHDANTLYAAADVLFRTRDGGESWTPISPDLTRNDKSKQGPSGGPITKDNTSVEYFCTIFAACESPHEEGVFWCGTDDGLVWVSRNDGKGWKNVTPPDLPEWAQINCIDAHPFERGGLYLAATRYKLDDFTPYLYKTTDWGETWTRIDAGIDRLHFTRALRADPDRRGLLYAGTERGVYVSRDDGARWQPLQLNLPIVPITDLAVKEGDLVAATQGRGYWILDDLSPLHALDAEIAKAPLHVFEPRPTLRTSSGRSRNPRNMGTNPQGGVVLRYLVKDEEAAKGLSLEILDTDGTVIRTYKARRSGGGDESGDSGGGGRRGRGGASSLPAKKGLNNFAWDMRYEGAERFPGMITWSGRGTGPRIVPGEYTARFKRDDWTSTVSFKVVPDPRSSATREDLVAQRDFLLGVRDKLTETHEAIRGIRDLRTQLGTLKKRMKELDDAKDVLAAIKKLEEDMKAVEEALYQTKNRSRQDPLNFPIRLNDKLAGVMSVASRGDFRPTKQCYAVRDELQAAIDAELSTLKKVYDEQLPALNEMIASKGVPALELPRKKKEAGTP